MKCIILAIGNELLNGEVTDSNSSFLQKELAFYSLKVEKVILLPDKMNVIEKEVQRGVLEVNYLFIMGGLGPTEDDLTRYAVAKALNKKLIQNHDEQDILKRKFEAYSRNPSPNNEKQTFFPEKAIVLDNPIGTASGFYIIEKECEIFVLPGVPAEMKKVYENQIMPILNKKLTRIVSLNKLTVKTFGIGESFLDALILKKIIPHHSVRWEILAKKEGVFLKFYPTDDRKENWKEQLIDSLNKHINRYIYGYDNDEMGGVVAKLLLNKNLTLSTVESSTGGYVSKYLTDRSGSSNYFLGGLITYSNDLKIRLANVDSELIQQKGAVSSEVAEAMARGGKMVMKSDICLSITGIAGPTGGTEKKPVGTVWFSVIDHKNRQVNKKRVFNGDREDIRIKSLFYGLNLVRLTLLDHFDFLQNMS